jgi:hypothetical protein
MIEALFLPYLVALVLVPSLVWWRWGLLASVGVTVIEVLLVPLVFYLLAINHLLPDISQGRPRPPLETHPMEYIRRSQADGYVLLFLGAIFPGMVAMVGGGLALACAAVHAAWRAFSSAGEKRETR